MSRVTLFQSDGNCTVISHADSSQDDQTREVVTLQNVYELASEIGEHFKKIIAEYGEEFNNHLIPSVVKVLEHLENTVILKEEDQQMIERLEKQINELTAEKQEREQHHMKFFSELEDIDESWRKENVELSQYVKHLRNENNRLAKSLSDSRTNSISDLKEDGSDNDQKKWTNQKIEKLKRRLSILSKEVDFKRTEVESLRCQNNSLLDENEILKNSLDNPETEHSKSSTSKNTQNQHYKNRIKSLEAEVELYKSLLKITTKEIKPNLSLYSRSSGSSPSGSTDNQQNETSPFSSLTNTSHQQPEVCERNCEIATLKQEITQDYDRPVQGPLPREPAEKNWSKQSKIWSFFPRLTQALTGKSFA